MGKLFIPRKNWPQDPDNLRDEIANYEAIERWANSAPLGDKVVAQNGVAYANATANFTGWYTQFSFTKTQPSTLLKVIGTATAYVSAAGHGVTLGMSIDGGASIVLGQYYFNAAADHRTMGMGAEVLGVKAGTRTIQLQAHSDGAVTLNTDTFDFLSLRMYEA